MLESVGLGYRIRGIPHHYWSMDTDLPEATLWYHAQAGFVYDSSLGLNDAAGFRRGIAWPFYPFLREKATVVPIREIQPTLMDGNTFYEHKSEQEALGELRSHIRQAFDDGAAIVLDWHLEQLNPARLHAAGPALLKALAELRDDPRIYWVSPGQLSDWWLERRRILLSQRPSE